MSKTTMKKRLEATIKKAQAQLDNMGHGFFGDNEDREKHAYERGAAKARIELATSILDSLEVA